MEPAIERALNNDGLIDITTIGRKTRKPSTIEIAFHNFDGVLYISGMPGKRYWYANLVANPQFTFHLKRSTRADLPARVTPVTGEAERRQVLSKIVVKWKQQDKLESFVQNSPLVKVQFENT